MKTPVEELRRKSNKVVTSPTSGNSYEIRRINQIDFNRHQLTTILPVLNETAEKSKEPNFLTRVVDSMQYVLERGADIFFGEESATPEGHIHANWIAGDEGFLSDEIMKFSGLDDETQAKLKDLLKNANGSGKSTPSAESSDDSQVNSLISDPSNAA